MSEELRQTANNAREQWTGKLDFILSCLGYAVGLGNVWRFPYLAYKNGGGAFVVPYFSSLFILGMPIFLLELSLGQFTSCGPTTCWEFCEICQGCGFSMSIISALTAAYYNVIIGWAIFFFFASFTADLPWATCGSWSTKYCYDRVRLMSVDDCLDEQGNVSKGLCHSPTNLRGQLWVVDREAAAANGVKLQFTAMEYFSHRVTGASHSDIGNPGAPRFELVLCLIFAWILVTACLVRGIKTSGKVVYVTATVPYLMLTVLLIRGLMLDGAGEGVKYYVTPNVETISEAAIWKDAAVQIFFSLSTSYGGLIALASYNKFHNNIVRDALLVAVGNCLTSIFAGFVIFSYLGFLSNHMDVPIDTITAGGVSLAFGVYPSCLTKLPASSTWSVIFFFMVILLGIDSQFVLVETVITAVVDTKPNLRPKKHWTVLAVCFCLFLVGLPMTTNAGTDILTILDTYSAGWNVLVIASIECICLSYLYGANRFLADIDVMVGGKCCCFNFNKANKLWWKCCWAVLTPAFCMDGVLLYLNTMYTVGGWRAFLFVIVFSLVDYTRIEHLPWWVDIIGWGITALCVGSIFVVGLFNIKRAPGTCREKLRYVTTPTRFWGPALEADRALVQNYAPDIVLNPYQSDNVEPRTEGSKDNTEGSPSTNVAIDVSAGSVSKEGKRLSSEII